jgi:hypothetical protein
MPEQMPSPQRIDKYIRAEMDALLHANEIYALDTYDPELVGHTMHQRDSLYWRSFLAAWIPRTRLRSNRGKNS